MNATQSGTPPLPPAGNLTAQGPPPAGSPGNSVNGTQPAGAPGGSPPGQVSASAQNQQKDATLIDEFFTWLKARTG